MREKRRRGEFGGMGGRCMVEREVTAGMRCPRGEDGKKKRADDVKEAKRWGNCRRREGDGDHGLIMQGPLRCICKLSNRVEPTVGGGHCP